MPTTSSRRNRARDRTAQLRSPPARLTRRRVFPREIHRLKVCAAETHFGESTIRRERKAARRWRSCQPEVAGVRNCGRSIPATIAGKLRPIRGPTALVLIRSCAGRTCGLGSATGTEILNKFLGRERLGAAVALGGFALEQHALAGL